MNACSFSLSSYQAELKALLFQITTVFEQNDISYLALFGTCLGAVRHGDIIPWDDDIDIGVRRADYFRVKKLIMKECPDLYFWDWCEDSKCCLTFGRIFRRINIADSIERRRSYIDLYIIDNVPDGCVMRMAHKLCCTVIARHLIRRCGAKIEYRTFTLTSSIIYLLGLPLYVFSVNFLRKAHGKIMGCFATQTNIKRYASVAGEIVSNVLISESKKARFGTEEIDIPMHAEKYLEAMYGNWRQIPPEGQRGEHAYKKNGEVIVAMPEDSLRMS